MLLDHATALFSTTLHYFVLNGCMRNCSTYIFTNFVRDCDREVPVTPTPGLTCFWYLPMFVNYTFKVPLGFLIHTRVPFSYSAGLLWKHVNVRAWFESRVLTVVGEAAVEGASGK
jgi:hypothetical protein